MKVEFVHYKDGDLLYRRYDIQHIPSLGEEVSILSLHYKVVERTFHYHDDEQDCVLIWIKDI